MRLLTVIFVLSIISLAFASNCFSGEVSYYIYESPGRSVAALVDDSQAAINTYTYADFGYIASQNETKANIYKYNGEQNESETGLIFLRNRYYDPTTGRFITKDPFPGVERDPQSLNSYVYVRNNPINSIDPTGEFEPITMIVLTAGAIAAVDMWTYRAAEWFYNKKYGLNLWSTETYGSKATWALATMFVPKPFSKTVEGISYGLTSTYAQHTLLSRSVKGIIGKGFTAGIKAAWDRTKSFFGGPPGGGGGGSSFLSSSWNLSSSGSLRSSLASYGGVSLSKTASLMLNINDIAGATYDENTGQIIFFGKEDVTLPQMDIDDLSVAVNSVYSGQNPGVSIGTEPSEFAGWMKVRYDGKTRDTQFGKVMFDADRLLKCLDLGFDNVTNQSVSSSVPGYQNMIQRELYGGSSPADTTETAERMWFMPKEMKLTKSDTGDAMIFSEATMELLTEATKDGAVVKNPEGEAFASHFTDHYDEFATRYKSVMVSIFLMIIALLGMDRRKRGRIGWVAV